MVDDLRQQYFYAAGTSSKIFWGGRDKCLDFVAQIWRSVHNGGFPKLQKNTNTHLNKSWEFTIFSFCVFVF